MRVNCDPGIGIQRLWCPRCAILTTLICLLQLIDHTVAIRSRRLERSA